MSCGRRPVCSSPAHLSNSLQRYLASFRVMNLHQLRALSAVGRYGSFSAAADVLHTVQSNVSAHVARLENELQAVLVDRATGQLTEQGKAVVSRATRVEMELEAIASDLAALRHEVIGTARVGMIGTTARWLVPPLLALSAERHPALRLEIIEGTSGAHDASLMTGAVDLAIGTRPRDAHDLVFEALFDEDLVLVVPSSDPIAERKEVSLRDVESLPMLLPLPGTAFRAEIDHAAAEAGVVLFRRAEVDGTRLLASLTFDGHGPAILPATAVPEYMRNSWSLVHVREMPRRQVGITTRLRGRPTAPARAVLDILREVTAPGSRLPEGLNPVRADAGAGAGNDQSAKLRTRRAVGADGSALA